MSDTVTLREIFDEDLEDVYCFLSETFNPDLGGWFNPGVTLDEWRLAYNRSWMPEKPNNGFMLLVNNTIVGVLCALYAQRQTQGGIRNVCNTTTWFVLDAYRFHSLKLMIAILDQKGFFFTSLSASPEVYELHLQLKFRSHVTTLVAIPNLPKLNYFSKKLEILADPGSISRYLDSHIKQISIDHMNLATVHQVVFRTSDETLLVIFDICTVRGLRATNILYLSNPDMFYQNQNEICSYFLLHNYTLFTRIHRCSMSKVPTFSFEIKRNITLFYNGDIKELPFPEFIYSEHMLFCR